MSKNKVIGLYYEFDRSFLVIAEKVSIEKSFKIKIRGEEHLHNSIQKITETVKKNRLLADIWHNEHATLAHAIRNTNQVDLTNENVKNELSDIYKSAIADKLLISDDTIDLKKPHHIRALSIALKGIDIVRFQIGLIGT